MKVIHIVMVKFKPEVTQNIIDQAIKDVVALKEVIPELKQVTAGKNFTDRNKGYEYAWVMDLELEKQEDITLYANHPSHVEFVTKYKPTFEDVLAFDYEA